jgi:hypothetical protein
VGFLSPWFLAGLVAIGLPIWLHLLRQYKRTPQPFSSLMFFERRIQSSAKHRRLKYLVLLALRLAVLTLLAIAFANPFVNRTETLASRRKLTVIAIDRSFSMRYGTRMQEAKQAAHRVLAALRGQQLAQVIAIDSHVESLTQPEMDRGMLAGAIDSIRPNDRTSSFGELARALRVMDQTTGMRLDVHLVSDMQQTSMPPSFRDLQLGPHTALQLCPVGKRDASNWTVETVTTAAHVYDPAHTRLTATIAGWHTPATSRMVYLVLDNKVLASKDVNVPADGHAIAEFLGFEVPYGMHRGEVRIEPHDSLPNDDSFAFSVERSDPRKVLFLYAGGRSREAYYYKAAMESTSGTGLIVQPAPIEEARNTDFSRFAFVVVNDIGQLDPNASRALCGYLHRGGAALIALGPKSGNAGRVPLSGDLFSEERQVQGAGFVDKQHPALAGSGDFENVQFFASTRIQPKPSEHVIAKFADGSPLLLEEPMGEGRILIFASTLDNSTNDFPLHAAFLPFVVQSGHYLTGSEDTASSVVAGTAVALRRTRDQSTAADVIAPDGTHALSLGEAAKVLTFDLDRAGFYEVQRADGRRLLMAVHSDRRESDLTTIPGETLALWRNTGNMSIEGQPAAVEQQTRPWTLWRYAMFLVLAAALVESVFASRYLRQERQTG